MPSAQPPRTLEELRLTVLPMFDNLFDALSHVRYGKYEYLELVERDAKWIRDIVRAAGEEKTDAGTTRHP